MRIPLWVMLIFLAILPGRAAVAGQPPIYFDVLELAKSGDVAGLQTLFDEIAERRTETGDSAEHIAAFKAFYNTHPAVEATVLEWLKAHPETPHAHVARAARLMNEASFMRGADSIRRTPPQSLQRMRELTDEALPLVETALSLDPLHLFAADNLSTIGRMRGSPDLQERSRKIAETYRKPENIFWGELYRFQPQWGGPPGGTDEYCRKGAELFPSVDETECRLIAAIGRRPREITAYEALERLQTEFPGRWAATVIELQLETHQYDEAASVIAEQYPPRLDWVERVYPATRDHAFVQKVVGRRLEDSPRYPQALRLMAMALLASGDRDGALAHIARALELGRSIPEVRAEQIRIYDRAGMPDDVVMATVEEALLDTGMNPTVYEAASSYASKGIVVWQPTATNKVRPEMEPLPENACWRRKILSAKPWICATYPDNLSCRPELQSLKDQILERLETETDCPPE